METAGEEEKMNTTSSDPVLGSTIVAKGALSDPSVNTTPLDGFRDATLVFTKTLEELFIGANDRIQQLQSQIGVLEEQAVQQKARIRSLEDQLANAQLCIPREIAPNALEHVQIVVTETQAVQSKPIAVEPVEEKKQPPASAPINDQQKQVENNHTKLDLRPKGSSKIEGGGTQSKHDQRYSSSSVTISHQDCRNQKYDEVFNKGPSKENSAGSGGFVFQRWMTSRDRNVSIWANKTYQVPLLSYLCRKHGGNCDKLRLWDSIMKNSNHLDDLDVLHLAIKKIESIFDSTPAGNTWHSSMRADRRLQDIQSIFEWDGSVGSAREDLIITPSTLKEIIPFGSINAYFDLLCRDGAITADIGSYLNLSKMNILGGNESNYGNDSVTFVEMNIPQSIINLADNRVDLVTCFVTLHHVLQPRLIIRELARILRPNGYLVVREHDCKNERSLVAKYLNFVHAYMLISGIDEAAKPPCSHAHSKQHASETDDWETQKAEILRYTKTIQYRARYEWRQDLENVGFRLIASVDYAGFNPQNLFTDVYRLRNK